MPTCERVPLHLGGYDITIQLLVICENVPVGTLVTIKVETHKEKIGEAAGTVKSSDFYEVEGPKFRPTEDELLVTYCYELPAGTNEPEGMNVQFRVTNADLPQNTAPDLRNELG